MFIDHISEPEPLTPENLKILQSVFDQLCREKMLAKHSPEAEELAELLLALFHKGIRKPTDLLMHCGNRGFSAGRVSTSPPAKKRL